MIEFFLRRRVVVNLMSLIFIVAGGYLFFTVKREAFPEVSYDIVSVTTIYPGATPEDVEKLITKPLEDEIRGVSGIDRVESSRTTDPAAPTFDWTSASVPAQFHLFALCPSPELGDN